MPSPRLAALAILGLATVTAAGFAWQQYQRAEALAAELAAAQNQAAEKLAATTPPPAPDSAPKPGHLDERSAPGSEDFAFDDSATDDAGGPPRRDRGNRRDPGVIMERLLQDPQFAEAMRTQQRAGLDNRYAALFAQLNLPPAQLTALKDLLAEKQNVPRDVFSAARAEGLGRENRGEIDDLIAATQAEIDADIRATIGEDAFATLNQYEQTTAQRNVVADLADRLSYAGTPLNTAQSEALVTIMAQAAGDTGDSGNSRFFGRGGGNSSTPITDDMIVRATGVLAPDQVNALRDLQAEQQAAATVRNAMRAEFRAQRGGGAPTPPPGG
ncbi:hypothetical protein [Actomonas aquatica]|uniref:Uncharacterized protein n=1 Tax=Actomonas aquatica TaxID=2866162 RepID=A0ABZ1C8I1_9BACT|nr:hypothetical protein [Opitutus sp. WL0086]WRQ88002.1 hypothetical protein K1X11_001185 [Opitutus sp. WL0086]